MAWTCYILNFRSLGREEVHQEDPHPPSPCWILGGQVVPDALSERFMLELLCFKFQVSSMCGSQSGTFPDGLDVLKQCSSKRRGRRYAVLEGRKKNKVQSLKKICRAMFCPNKKFLSNVPT